MRIGYTSYEEIWQNMLNNKFIRKLKFYENDERILVYIVDLAYYQSGIEKYWTCLSPYEKAEAKKFYSNHLRELYIKSHGILRYILACYTNYNPKSLKFSYFEYHKPYIKGSNIQFNMSHSEKKVGYAISFGRQVGIDLQYHNRNINIQELSHLVFSSDEQIFFNTLDLKEQVKFFYDAWTIKEATIKADGRGLFYPINTIETLSILNEQTKLVFTKKKNNKFKQWSCNLLKIHSEWSGAVVIES